MEMYGGEIYLNKIEMIDYYILEIELAIANSLVERAREREDEIVPVFDNELKGITYGLDNYIGFGLDRQVNYLSDIKLLKAKLENYKANLELDEWAAERELEKLRLQQSILTITNNASNENTITNEINVNNDITNVIKIIESTKDLDEIEKEELQGQIAKLNLAVTTQNKEKGQGIVKEILKFVVDKGTDLGIALLPYIGSITRTLNQM